MAEPATAERPSRRRTSWSLKTIVEDVAGRPIEELQDPERPVHPYVQAHLRGQAAVAPRASSVGPAEPPYDPVDHISPPLVGATARAYHGAEFEHDAGTLARHAGPPGGPPPGPLRRPERLYLHYLLLHLDRLSEPALRYLRTALDEEFEHRHPRVAGGAPPPEVTPSADP